MRARTGPGVANAGLWLCRNVVNRSDSIYDRRHAVRPFAGHASRSRSRSAIAAGADGLFIETHPNPAAAKSDGANMLKLDLLETLLEQLVRIRKAVI